MVKSRNAALAGALIALAILFYAVTVVRMRESEDRRAFLRRRRPVRQAPSEAKEQKKQDRRADDLVGLDKRMVPAFGKEIDGETESEGDDDERGHAPVQRSGDRVIGGGRGRADGRCGHGVVHGLDLF